MSRQELAEIQKDSIVRLFDPGSVFVHNRHLLSGFRTTKSCGVCATGLASSYKTAEQAKPVDKKDGVSEGDGANEEGDSTSSRDFRDYTSGETDQLLDQG